MESVKIVKEITDETKRFIIDVGTFKLYCLTEDQLNYLKIYDKFCEAERLDPSPQNWEIIYRLRDEGMELEDKIGDENAIKIREIYEKYIKS